MSVEGCCSSDVNLLLSLTTRQPEHRTYVSGCDPTSRILGPRATRREDRCDFDHVAAQNAKAQANDLDDPRDLLGTQSCRGWKSNRWGLVHGGNVGVNRQIELINAPAIKPFYDLVRTTVHPTLDHFRASDLHRISAFYSGLEIIQADLRDRRHLAAGFEIRQSTPVSERNPKATLRAVGMGVEVKEAPSRD
jgi:hypothetical protein